MTVPCHHLFANHVCGTHARYVLDRCRCADCCRARAEYDRKRSRWDREFPLTDPPLVSSEPARAHVSSLMAQGMGQKRIAALAGVPASAVGTIIWGRHDRAGLRIRRETSEALLAVSLDVADGAKVDGTEARSIVSELLARGWWAAEIGRAVHGPGARSLQLSGELVFAGTLRILRRLLAEPVPLRKHNRTKQMFDPDTGHRDDVEPTTPGVPAPERPFPEWLRDLDRKALFSAVRLATAERATRAENARYRVECTDPDCTVHAEMGA